MKRPRLIDVTGAGSLALLCFCAPQLRAQTPRLEFEVASVKVSPSGANGVRGGCHGIDSKYSGNQMAAAPPLGRCIITDGRLSHLISIAYDIRSVGLIKGAQDWMITGSERFSIDAKAEDPTKATEQQLLGMLQNLLADRFKLKFHRESKDMPGFALLVAKNGPKLQEATGDEVVTSFGASLKPVASGEPITLTARKYSMPMLANLLSQIGPGPMMDRTELHGVYDFKLAWDDAAGPSLFTALQEQLGLKLESQKVPVSFFVIESAQKPGEN
jgi:uncharacterized protein (TIGR03435 family)